MGQWDEVLCKVFQEWSNILEIGVPCQFINCQLFLFFWFTILNPHTFSSSMFIHFFGSLCSRDINLSAVFFFLRSILLKKQNWHNKDIQASKLGLKMAGMRRGKLYQAAMMTDIVSLVVYLMFPNYIRSDQFDSFQLHQKLFPFLF